MLEKSKKHGAHRCSFSWVRWWLWCQKPETMGFAWKRKLDLRRWENFAASCPWRSPTSTTGPHLWQRCSAPQPFHSRSPVALTFDQLVSDCEKNPGSEIGGWPRWVAIIPKTGWINLPYIEGNNMGPASNFNCNSKSNQIHEAMGTTFNCHFFLHPW